MIWAALAMLGIPLWLIGIFLFVLLRSRRAVKAIPGSFDCKVRATSGTVGKLRNELPRYKDRAHWVHDVLVVHGGNPFLIVTMPLGVEALAAEPAPPGPATKHLKGIDDAVSVTLRLDSGGIVEVVCAKTDLPQALGPLAVS